MTLPGRVGLAGPTRPCPICHQQLDDEQWRAHMTGERCTECGAPQCAALKAHRPFCPLR